MRDEVQFLAELYGWEVIKEEPKLSTVTLKRKGTLLEVNHAKMTVVSTLHHPRLGRTSLKRRSVDMEMLEDILFNPRVHTDKGEIVRSRQERKAWQQEQVSKRRKHKWK